MVRRVKPYISSVEVPVDPYDVPKVQFNKTVKNFIGIYDVQGIYDLEAIKGYIEIKALNYTTIYYESG